MTAREKLKAFIMAKKQEEKEENKRQYIERKIDAEIDYNETISEICAAYVPKSAAAIY